MAESMLHTKLSIVVPLFNEEESVEQLYMSIVEAVGPCRQDFEIIFVNDGSSDGTASKAESIASEDSRLCVVNFRRNYGQTPAMAAGIDLARGDIIVTMDGDLQNDPKDILNLVDKIEEGFDIVVGWRFNRQDKLITRKIPSKIANWMIGKVTGVPIKDNGCSLKAYKAEIVKSVPLYNEMHRFIPAMMSITGARISEIKVRHHARQFGESKYGLSRIYKVLLDMLAVKTIIGFAQRPLIWFGTIAIPFFLLGVALMVVSIIPIIANGDAMKTSLAGSGILMVALGILLVLCGAIGELVFSVSNTGVSKRHTLVLSPKPDSIVANAEQVEFSDERTDDG